METEKENKETNEAPVTEEVPKPKKEKKPFPVNPKIFIIGLPLFIVQLVAVYFITANILLSKVQENASHSKESENEVIEKKKVEQIELGKFIFSIDDIIVNPAGTEGKRLLLASIGFDISSEEEQQILKSKEILVKDLIISSLSSKSLNELSNSAYKDSLKAELVAQVRNSIPSINLNTVYLSKFIIQ